MKTTGIILVIAGVLILAYQGFTYSTTHQDAQIGDLQIQHQQTQSVYLPPILGVTFLAVGAVAIFLGVRRTS